jgi:His-Xaa-Ser system protein HxsD
MEGLQDMPVVTICVDSRVFRLSAVKKAAYRLGDRFYAGIQVDPEPENTIRVTLTAKTDRVSLETIEGEFRNELLDQDLREMIAEETEGVRNLLLAQAFSGVSLTGDDADAADYRNDPLRIGPSQNANH